MANTAATLLQVRLNRPILAPFIHAGGVCGRSRATKLRRVEGCQ